MRKIVTTAAIALGLVLMSAAPALATGGTTTDHFLTVWCTPNNGHTDINGTLTVDNGDSGPVLLTLFGGKGTDWGSTWSSTVNTVKGQTTYSFEFDPKYDSSVDEFKLWGAGVWSRIINVDECGFRVPEAPNSALLMLGALPLVGVVSMKVAGVKLPLPHWRRIA